MKREDRGGDEERSGRGDGCTVGMEWGGGTGGDKDRNI